MEKKTIILLIEDDLLMSRMYQRALELEHFSVITAFDGEEGLEKSTTPGVELILLDSMMPKKSGLEVLQALKASTSVSQIPVVMLTNLTGQKDIDTAMELGAVKYMVKSESEPQDVAAVVREILSLPQK